MPLDRDKAKVNNSMSNVYHTTLKCLCWARDSLIKICKLRANKMMKQFPILLFSIMPNYSNIQLLISA